MRFTLLITLALIALTAHAKDTVFVGTANRESPGAIYACELDNGKLGQPRKLVELGCNTQIELSAEGSRLYASAAASKGEASGDLIAFRVLGDGGLEELNRVRSGVDHFCSLAVSPDGQLLIGTSFGLGVVSCFRPNDEGGIGEQACRIELPKVARDSKALARAHDVEFTRDGELAFVADLFSNRVYAFLVNPENGYLKQIGFTTADAFLGPRHLILNEDDSLLYVLSQKGSNVVAFRHDGKGGLDEIQTISTLPADYNGPQNHSAEILIHPSGEYLYASNRIHDSLVGFQIGDDGTLTKLQSISSGGANPWSFVFDSAGEHLICSNLKSSNLVVFRIDQATGQLRQLEGEVTIPEPVSLEILGGE